LSGLASLVEPVKVYYQWRPQLQDADDEMVLETALNGFADVIVTHNVRDFEDVASRFGLRVLSPGSLVKELMR
jgi:predicted nucleic acid-binding protein